MLRNLPQKNSLRANFELVREIRKIDELPQRYDGNIMFELPYVDPTNRTIGANDKFDGHVWRNAVTSNIVGFDGIVRFKKCVGHLMRLNNMYSGVQRSKEMNEKVWTGRLSKWRRKVSKPKATENASLETATAHSIVEMLRNLPQKNSLRANFEL
ncbi:hypothetical protein GOP47_0030802, partial [Adiantum capillus-veneris]